MLQLGLTAAALAIDAAIENEIYKSGITPLTTLNEEIKNAIKINKSLEEPDFSSVDGIPSIY